MESWHVSIRFTTSDVFDEDKPFEVTGDLGEYGASMSVSREFNAGEVILTIDADSAITAMDKGAELTTSAFSDHGIVANFVSVQAQSQEAFDAELAEPTFPEVVGYAEIAEMAGVTRQRARQFAKVSAFPSPVIETAQGPLMAKAAVQRWLEIRNTRSGRPRTTAAA